MNPGDLGFIFHVGLYNFYAYDDTAKSRKLKVQNGSQYYYSKLKCEEGHISKSALSTKEYHAEKRYGDYFDAPLNINRTTIISWLNICKMLGAKYVCITVKHIDGYCLWDTKTGSRKSNVDIIRIFVEEAKARDLKVGFYYSWVEHGVNMTVQYFLDVCDVHFEELLTYNPDMFIFDHDASIVQSIICRTIDEMLKYFRTLNVIFNDKIGKKKIECDDRAIDPDFLSISSRNFTNRQGKMWQYMCSIGMSCGYNKSQLPEHYKTGKDLNFLYQAVTASGGSLMINIAMDHNGIIDENEMRTLNQLYTYRYCQEVTPTRSVSENMLRENDINARREQYRQSRIALLSYRTSQKSQQNSSTMALSNDTHQQESITPHVNATNTPPQYQNQEHRFVNQNYHFPMVYQNNCMITHELPNQPYHPVPLYYPQMYYGYDGYTQQKPVEHPYMGFHG